ncbi:CDP-alcohol phosphatidyltransferase family protein [Kumtagia ephedrae]|uniref:CDP-diacylglycerol--serine O-phosphatidyltransferase n=1 Tax=Kumtagia ephedrae TaxID=2116701 RepID=A0A2P7RKR1_9HYPH|nr:phosphatidylcholine/phosphatidylserine synthase [Mesorhizobium ephedrae]PSJ50745.1 CDP-diacylglycerol--serine O-phosphatidyltransferase [Mesorhizobium ephedrae]
MPRPFQRFEPHGRGGPRIREIPLRLMLPNLITVLAICAGLSGIRLAFENRFEIAVVMVLIAAFLDGIDGRLARMLKATSKFGAQMDSLADIVNFGVAPALVLYAFLLDQAGSPGWIAALLFAIACGLRLARFNVLDEDLTRPAWQAEYFVGIPAPAGAVIVLLPIYLVFIGVVEPSRTAAFIASGFTIMVAFLLVSRLPVWSAKRLRVPGDTVMPMILGVVFFALLLFTYPWQTLSVGVLAYLIFLPLSAAAYSRRAARESAKELAPEPPQP